MRTGLIAQKIGMSRIYDENGIFIPVTLLQVKDCKIVAHKTNKKDGYDALVLGCGNVKEKHISKPLNEFYKKIKLTPSKRLKEFRVSEDNFLEVGKSLFSSHFVKDQLVDITGISVGKGFAGVVKRHNFATLRATHGVSLTHRSHGSTGHCQDPGRVFKGKKMAGRLGAKQVTIQNLKVVNIDEEKCLIIVKGAVPGYTNSYVTIKDSVKKKLPENIPFPVAVK